MFNATNTLNICSRNDSLAVLLKAINRLTLERDFNAHVFDRVFKFLPWSRPFFRILCHLVWNYLYLFIEMGPLIFIEGPMIGGYPGGQGG